MRTRAARRLAAVLTAACAVTLFAAPSAGAGVLDGSINDLSLLDHGNVLSAMFSSTINAEGVSTNRTNRSRPRANPPILRPEARCQATVTVTDPNGAAGSVTAQVPADGPATTPLAIVDQVPDTTWHAGDLDHFAGDLVCTDPATGAIVGMLTIDEDRTAV